MISIGEQIRCLAAPRWAPPQYQESMPGQIGVVIGVYPPDPDDPDDRGAIGIRYPVTPYSNNTIAQGMELEGLTWKRID